MDVGHTQGPLLCTLIEHILFLRTEDVLLQLTAMHDLILGFNHLRTHDFEKHPALN